MERSLRPAKKIPIYDPTRCVDVAMGLIAKQWGQFGDFSKSLSARQDADGIEKVMDSLKAAPKPSKDMKSVTKLTDKSMKSKNLLGGE